MSINSTVVAHGVTVRKLDTGFVAFGTNGWFPVEFDDPFIAQQGTGWHPTDPCPAAGMGTPLKARACISNGAAVASQTFELNADYTLRHVATGLCAYSNRTSGGAVVLDSCSHALANLQFINDYTRVRNTVVPFTLEGSTLRLTGALDGAVTVAAHAGTKEWNTWVYFPNTRQLRNQYVANIVLGYPQCLSTC